MLGVYVVVSGWVLLLLVVLLGAGGWTRRIVLGLFAVPAAVRRTRPVGKAARLHQSSEIGRLRGIAWALGAGVHICVTGGRLASRTEVGNDNAHCSLFGFVDDRGIGFSVVKIKDTDRDWN